MGPDTFSDARTLAQMFPATVWQKRLRHRLRFIDIESVDADLEGGAAFLDDQAQAGPRRVAEIDVVRLVAHADDRFRCDAGQCRRLAGVEAIDRSLASERLSDGQRCKPALPDPLARRRTGDRFPGVDLHLQRRADL